MSMRSIELLLVEDNAADVDLIREALKRSRVLIKLYVVDRGEAAVAFLNGEGEYTGAVRPDLILLDLNLPGMDGREVLHIIKRSETLQSIPVVILTSSEADMDVLKTYAMGANSYVVKPVGFPEFLAAVTTIEDFWFDLVKLPTRELMMRYQFNRPGTAPHPGLIDGTLEEIRTLVVEDDDADADLILEMLKKGKSPKFTSERVVRLEEANARLKCGQIDLVLLDLSLPDSHGFDTIASLRHSFPFLPIVVTTGLDDPDMGIRAVKEGAQDYLVKGQMGGDTLVYRVLRYAIERKKSEIVQLELLAAEKETRSRADKAVSIRDEFLSIASHELKTPLTSLMLQIQLFHKLFKDPSKLNATHESMQLEALLGRLDHDISRFGGLIETLLDISRIQAGRLSLERSRFDLVEMVKDVIVRLKADMDSAGCQIDLKSDTAVFGQWDRFRLEQVLINLLTNTAKYAYGMPVEIRISGDENNSSIEVQDHGPGIALEDQERIFSRFERAVEGQSVAGLGLGLYIVRQIIDAHCGTITVKSGSARKTVSEVIF